VPFLGEGASWWGGPSWRGAGGGLLPLGRDSSWLPVTGRFLGGGCDCCFAGRHDLWDGGGFLGQGGCLLGEGAAFLGEGAASR